MGILKGYPIFFFLFIIKINKILIIPMQKKEESAVIGQNKRFLILKKSEIFI